MSTEPEEEGVEYDVIPERLADGEALIHDPAEFFDLTDSLAAIVRDGALFVLDRKTFKWRNVEDVTRPSGTVRALK